MNKLFTKIATAFVGIAMAIGVGVAIGNNSDAKRTEAAVSWTSVGSLTAGDVVVFAYEKSNVKKELTGVTTIGTATDYSTAGSPNATYQLTVFTGSSSGSFAFKDSSGNYLSWSSGNTLATASSISGASSWTITGSAGSIKLRNVKTTARYLMYNTGSPRWATYGNTSQAGFILYRKTSTEPTKLATPKNVTYDSTNQRVKWNAVDHASSYKFSSDNGASYTSTSTNLYASVSLLTTGTTYNCKVVAVGDGSSYADSDAASFQFTKTEPPVYTSVTVTGGSVQGTDIGSAYIQCSASATGTNIPASPSFTWYVTENDTYGTTTSVANKASIDTTGKVTFVDSCTVYVWALAPDGTTHNTSGYAAVSGNLKGSQANPYSVSEAKAIADTLSSGQNNGLSVYCIGIVTAVGGSTSSKATSPVTFTIKDVNDSTKTLMAFSIQNGSSTDPSATNYVAVDYEVLIFGYLINYSGTKEIGFVTGDSNSSGFVYSHAPASIDSIAVKTAPNKTAYKSGESFDATGLVITATYTDESTKDIAYADSPTSFSFSPSTITTAGNVQITYQGKTCNQAVTLVTVTNVTGVASAPSEVYKDGSIDPDDVTLNVTYSDSTSGTVKATSVTCDTSAIAPGVTATATYSPATGTNTATFTVDVVKEPVYDTVVDELVLSDTGVSGNTYASWSGVVKTSGSVYAGFTNENSSNPGGGIGMRADTSKDATGIWVTSSAGVATKVEVVWTTTSSRTLYVFGKDTAYSSANYYSNMEGTEVGSITYSSASVDLSAEYQYIGICVTGGAAGFSKIKITWKVEGADYPLTANPTLSTGAAASVSVGKNLALTVTTTPSNSDERLLVSSSNENYVTVSGAGKSFTIHGVAEGSATVTVKGAKGTYQSTTTIAVTAASKTYEDKILDTTSLGITSYDTDITNSYTEDGVDYTCYNVMKNNGLQFKSSPAGYIANKEVLYTGTNTEIKSITLVMNKNNNGYITAYEGTSANPDQDVCSLVGTWDNTGVNTYTFSSGMTYFKLLATGTTNVDKIIIELVDEADSVLKEARLAALAILRDLSGLCGGDDAPGYVSQSDWNTLNADLTALNLSADAKQFLKDATRISLDNLSQGGAEIENAMAHYDACVEKFGYTPFIGITNAQAHRIIPIALISSKTTNTSLIVIVTVGIAAIAIGGYFLLRKKKED